LEMPRRAPILAGPAPTFLPPHQAPAIVKHSSACSCSRGYLNRIVLCSLLPRNFSLQQAKSHTLSAFLTRTGQLTDLHGRPELAQTSLEERPRCSAPKNRPLLSVRRDWRKLFSRRTPSTRDGSRKLLVSTSRHRLNCCRDPSRGKQLRGRASISPSDRQH
jgi:hypothetical protein